MRFILHAVDARKTSRSGPGFTMLRGETGDRIEPNSGDRFALVGKSHFDAVREAGDRDIQMGMVSRQVVEGLEASGYDGGLQLIDGGLVKASGISEVVGRASDGGGESPIRVDLNLESFGFSGHGC